MRWWVAGCALLAVAGRASAQEADAPRAGSPSNATTTVSPFTVAQAVDAPAAPSSGVDLSLGTSYASGDFGAATDTEISNTAFGVRYFTGNVRLSASIPYMWVRSNGRIFTGIDSTPVVVAPGTGRRLTSKGLGDLTLGGSYAVPGSVSGFELELSGRVKVPTAGRSSGLSSGKTDASIGAQVTRAIGRFAPYASFTYRWLGRPDDIDVRNGFAASAGGSVLIGERTVVLGSYHFAQAASRYIPDSHELFLGASRRLGEGKYRLTAFVTGGLSKGAAGVSGGLSGSVTL